MLVDRIYFIPSKNLTHIFRLLWAYTELLLINDTYNIYLDQYGIQADSYHFLFEQFLKSK